MTSQMTAFAIAVGGTSLVCYLLMTRLQNRRANRSAPHEDFLLDGALIPPTRAGSSPVGWVAVIPHSTVREIQAIQGAGIAEAAPMGEAGMAEAAVAIDPSPAPTTQRLDSFQFALG